MLKRIVLVVLAVLLGGIGLLVGAIVAFRPADPAPVAIDFTRFLGQYSATSAAASGSFVATSGTARLQVSCAGPMARLTVSLNDKDVLTPATDIACGQTRDIPVTLAATNTIAIAVDGTTTGTASIRIKQRDEVQMHVLSRVHFNANVSSFKASRAFYGMLGFSTISGFPDTNTQEMARAIGIQTPTSYDGSKGEWAGGYLLHGELIGLGFPGGAIDLIEFTTPRDVAPPYRQLNHLGMARAALQTTDIDADHKYLTAQGVRFLSAPSTRADGTRFVIFRDPDGIFYELTEVRAADGENKPTETTHLTGFGALGVNASDFERSRAWYQMFGFNVTRALPGGETAEVAKALGFDTPISTKGALLTHAVDGSTMELVQWLSPYDPERAYPIPVNHIGIHRTALATTDIVADVATLKAQGVEFVSPITPCCSGPDSSGSIVAFYDPDGTIVELVEQPLLSWLMPSLLRMRDVFSSR